MSHHRQARFKIHRVDSPHDHDQVPYQAFWEIEGRTFRVAVWTDAQWEQMPHRSRPQDARALNGGWMLLRPIESSWPMPVAPRPHAGSTASESD